MTSTQPSAIAGVNTQTETLITHAYPSIASTETGQFLGRLYESFSGKILGIRLSHLLFVLPTAPLAALIYLMQIVIGKRFRLTNQALEVRSMLGERLFERVELDKIGSIDIEQQAGQEFYHAADLIVKNTNGDKLFVMEGISRPYVFQRNIQEAQQAKSQVAAALAHINNRS